MDLEQRVKLLEDEVKSLRAEVAELKSKNINTVESHAYKSSESKPKLKLTKLVSDSIKEQKTNKPFIRKSNMSEGLLGRNIMGVLASVLIFIGIASFVVLIYDKLTELMKIVGMYSLSGVILIAGIYLNKLKPNSFSLSLTGCGAGALFISILATNIVFHQLGTVGTYLLVAVWIAGVLLLSKYLKSGIISIIVQIGALIAIVLGFGFLKTELELVMLCIFTLFALVTINISNRRYHTQSVNIIGLVSTCLILLLASYNLYEEVILDGMADYMWKLADIIILAQTLIAFVYSVFYINHIEIKKVKLIKLIVLLITSFTVIGIYYILFTTSSTEYSINQEPIIHSFLPVKEAEIIYAILLLFIIIFINRCKLREALKVFIVIPVVVAEAFMVPQIVEMLLESHSLEAAGYFVLYIPLFYFGYRKQRKSYIYGGMLLMLVDIIVLDAQFFNDDNYILINLMLTVYMLSYVIGLILLLVMKHKYSDDNIDFLKTIVYIVLNTIIFKYFDEIWFEKISSYKLMFVVLSVVNLVIAYSGYMYDWDDDEIQIFGSNKDIYKYPLTTLVINLGCIWVYAKGIVSLYDGAMTTGWNIVYILLTGALTFVRIDEIIERFRDSKWAGILIGLKITAFAVAASASCVDINNYPYLVSIICILVSVGCIAAGFYMSFKSLRLYGLGITMISVFKLVAFDLSSLNSILRVISFIVGGVLCFIISAIYNYINKRLIEK